MGPTQAAGAIFTIAVEQDRIVPRNPCRIDGAGKEESNEREVIPLPVVFALADAVPVRYRVLVLLATFADLRWGESAKLDHLHGGADVHLVLARRNIGGHAAVIDRSREPEFAEGLSVYLRAVPQARRAVGLSKHASPSLGDAGLRQISTGAVLVRVDLDD